MIIEKEFDKNDLTVNVEGRIDTITSQELESTLNDEIENITSLTLNFSNLEYISSAGLRVLIATQKKMNEKDIPMVITNVNNTIKEIFRMSGFDKILEIK
jgi:anti-anti-sigma factor